MQWLRPLGKALSNILNWIGLGWQRLICWVFNLRRGRMRRRRPDYVVFTLDGELAERTPPQPWIYRQIPMFQPPAALDNLSEALRHIAEAGHDPVYGARPLKRYIQRHVETALGRRIIAGEVPDGSLVRLEERDGALHFAVSQLS
jgi:hypothetical protein